MKPRIFARSFSLVPLLVLIACGGGKTTTTAAMPAGNPQMVFEGPGVPGSTSIQEISTGNLDGSNIVQITHDGVNEFLAHFSPDGTRLVYTKFLTGEYGDAAPETDIFIYTFATAAETRLTTVGDAFQAVWSPDGQQIAFGTYNGTGLYLMNPDGTSRTQVTDGGPSCTPPGMEQYGDSDPGFSADSQTVYSSRGLSPLPADPTQTLRHLYAFSSDAYTPGKVETDLSLASQPNCKVGVPKGSPDGTQILVFLFCPSNPQQVGVTLTNTTGTTWTFVTPGFGADWNPTTQP